jgi:predicted Zn-dependent peptidase
LFKESVKGYTKQDIQRKINQIFSLEKQVIFVLGDKKIESKLKTLTKKYGKLTVLDYKDYL